MKKTTIILLLTFVSFTAHAQLWLGGEIGVSINNTKLGSDQMNNSSFIKIAPEAGYGLNDRWAVGLRLGYTHLTNHEVQFIDITAMGNCNQFSVEPFARYTVFQTNTVSFFVDGGVSYSALYKSGYDSPMNNFGVGIRPGVSLALGKTVSIVGHLGDIGYDHSWMDFHGNSDWALKQSKTLKSNAFNFRLLGSISLGANIHI